MKLGAGHVVTFFIKVMTCPPPSLDLVGDACGTEALGRVAACSQHVFLNKGHPPIYLEVAASLAASSFLGYKENPSNCPAIQQVE